MHNYHIPSQHGFSPDLSTYISLINILDILSKAIDTSLYSIGIFVYLTKGI